MFIFLKNEAITAVNSILSVHGYILSMLTFLQVYVVVMKYVTRRQYITHVHLNAISKAELCVPYTRKFERVVKVIIL